MKPAAKKAPLPDSSSDDDDEPVKKPVAKKASPAMKPAAKKAPLPDSSDDDDEPVKKPVAKSKASPAMKPAAKKAPLPDSSSDDDDEPVKKPVAKRTLLSERSDEEEPPKKNVRAENGSHEKKSLNNDSQEGYDHRNDNRNGNGGIRRFERIDPTKVVFVKEELKDNRPGSEHMVLRQNQEMMRVKGKNFNKLKQKNKAKFYAAGVDTTVRAFQFDDSD
ncbi:uncharacterized protein TM35_000251120 [Trypanosoma theileri]|uniref:Srp40 C-terminal domain-containing protein n=1 Tax=Trypanosoma theileri TaxID=67003 RepID=A0A1X0NQ23_9TRYP|nr:uncharacterized protein TM35_000251120 [Trypanosoma theileri]ORC86816.1 hypothetical protein TM35_000251120 [Trypanosoma theileri]